MTAAAGAARAAPPSELPAETTQASRFGKTRTAQSTAVMEDYVELIADLLATHEAAEADAEGLEHHVSEATLAAFARFLAKPKAGAG